MSPAPGARRRQAGSVGTRAYSWKHLGYKTSRHDLVNSNNEYGRLWNDYIQEFGEDDDAVVVVEGESRTHVVPVLQELATALAGENKHFHAVPHGVNLEKVRSKGLHYLPPEELLGVEKFLDEAGAVVHGDWARLSVGGMVQGMTMHMQYEKQQTGGANAAAPPASSAAQPPEAATNPATAGLTSGLTVAPEQQLTRLGDSLLTAIELHS